MYEQILRWRRVFSWVSCLALEAELLMMAFKTAQDKESTILVLCSTETPPELDGVGFFHYSWTELCKTVQKMYKEKKKLE